MNSTITAAVPSTKRQILIALAAVGSVVLVLALVKYLQVSAAIEQSKAFAPPPEAVTSTVAAETSWVRTLEAVGTLTPEKGVTVSAEQPGKVVKINFESGALVQHGDVLVELDTSVEEANLESALARQNWAQRQLARAQRLRQSNAVSQEVLDDAVAQAQQASAEVESLRAVISKKKIAAPFTGHTGIRLVNLGQYVAAGAEIVPLHSLNPLFVDFTVPQKSIADISSGQSVEVSVDAYRGTVFSGVISAVDPQIDENTRNVHVRATVPNPDGKLRPGMFGQVKVLLPREDTIIALPATSIQYAPYGDTVYVIEPMKDPTGKEYLGVRQQIVTLGRRVGDQVAVLSGIKPGEHIATSGLFKLHPGAAVVVNNSFAPSSELAPKPADT